MLAGAMALSAVVTGAWAKDALQATVPASSAYVFEENGNPLAKGTYAIGTLKVYMIVVGTEWPETIPAIPLNLAVRAGDSKPNTLYSVPIRLRQAGGDLTLSPSPATHDVSSAAWTGASSIGITVPEEIRNDPDMNADGTEIVGNLQIEPTMVRRFLDTVTTVRIFAKLVHPVGTCLKHATFVTDTPLNRNLSDSGDGLDFTYKYSKSAGIWSFGWTVSPGNNQIRDNVLIVNTCETQETYDARIGLASGFQATSPGNVVESYVSQVANAPNLPLTDPFAELKAVTGNYGAAVEEGTSLCVATNTLAGLHSQWLRAKVELVTTGFTTPAGIPDAGSTYQTFTSNLYANDSACANSHGSAEGQATALVYVKSKACDANLSNPNQSCSP
jgi:hypothetical protein